MKITQIQTLTAETKGVEVTGTIIKVFAPKPHTGKYGAFTTQSFVIKDLEGIELLCSLHDKTMEEKLIGQQITITNGVARQWTDREGTRQTVLDVRKTSAMFFEEEQPKVKEINVEQEEPTLIVTVAETPKEETSKEVEQPAPSNKKKTYTSYMLESTTEIHDLVTKPEFVTLWRNMTGDATPSSEDIRAFIISNIISKQRTW